MHLYLSINKIYNIYIYKKCLDAKYAYMYMFAF